jgi:uncharacterized protein (TIRG00374 family)
VPTPAPRGKIIRRVLALVIAGLALYFVFPAFLRVLSAWPHLAALEPWWFVGCLIAEISSFFCGMMLLRLLLRTTEWFAIITAGLTGNAVTNTLPGGDALGASIQFQMLSRSGIDTVQTASGLAASSIIGVAALFSLPIFALPVLFGGVAVSSGLEHAAELGLGGFVLITTLGVLFLATDPTLRFVGRVVQWLINRVPRRPATHNLPDRLIAERDLVREDLGRNWWKAVLLVAGRIGLDYGSLLMALRAVGARPNPSLVLLAYAATTVIALIPLTPGGLGIVEASLSGLLVLANIPSSNAIVATLAFRLGSFWLPNVAGLVAYVLYRRRFGALGAGNSKTPGSTNSPST